MGLMRAINSLEPALREALELRLGVLMQQLQVAFVSRDAASFKAVFEQIYQIAEEQLGDSEFVAAIRPLVVPIVAAAGATETGAGAASAAMAAIAALGAATAEMLAVVLQGILWTALAVVALVIIAYLCKAMMALSYKLMPKSTPQPMQTPNWNHLQLVLNHPEYGPMPIINKQRSRPVGITLA